MKYFLFTISTLCLAYVMYDMSMWIILCSQTSSFEEAKSMDLNRHPQFLKDPLKNTLLNIFLGILAGSGFLRILNTGVKVPSGLLKFLVVLSFFLASWQLFSLM